jgi:UDPglucose 6-dehydrogenase
MAAGESLGLRRSEEKYRVKIAVFGLWHLGCVTAACCAKYFDVIGLDFDVANVDRLRQGLAPIFEPGLNESIASGLATGKLSFTTDPKIACADADVLWLTHDTPVGEDDKPDPAPVLADLRSAIPFLRKDALVLISSQLPAGTCDRLATEFTGHHFAYSPENLRLGQALDAFEKADRVVVGIRDGTDKSLLEELFSRFTSRILFMGATSAEMVKHALNSFLALSVTFINEIARLCEHVGADAREVAAGLKSEPRIGQKAYLSPGGPFAGGTLARDVVSLVDLAAVKQEPVSVIPAIKESNDRHRNWAFKRLRSILGNLEGKEIAILGLTYTPNTSTLRRSWAVELCRNLLADRAAVRGYDPAVKQLPEELNRIHLATGVEEAVSKADAAVVCTEWPQFREAEWSGLIAQMGRALVLDPNGFLENELKNLREVEHLSVGHRR